MVVDELIGILEPLVNNKVYRQGSLATEYPSLFITFFEVESKDNSHYDNKARSYRYDFDVNVYGNTPSDVYDKMEEVINVLKTNGYIVSGKGIDIPCDDKNFIGRHIEIIKIEREV